MPWERHGNTTTWVRLRVAWDFRQFRTRLCVVQGLDSASTSHCQLCHWHIYYPVKIFLDNTITPIPMSTLNETLLIGWNPDGMSYISFEAPQNPNLLIKWCEGYRCGDSCISRTSTRSVVFLKLINAYGSFWDSTAHQNHVPSRRYGSNRK
jgi:hypothetical protein